MSDIAESFVRGFVSEFVKQAALPPGSGYLYNHKQADLFDNITGYSGFGPKATPTATSTPTNLDSRPPGQIKEQIAFFKQTPRYNDQINNQTLYKFVQPKGVDKALGDISSLGMNAAWNGLNSSPPRPDDSVIRSLLPSPLSGAGIHGGHLAVRQMLNQPSSVVPQSTRMTSLFGFKPSGPPPLAPTSRALQITSPLKLLTPMKSTAEAAKGMGRMLPYTRFLATAPFQALGPVWGAQMGMNPDTVEGFGGDQPGSNLRRNILGGTGAVVGGLAQVNPITSVTALVGQGYLNHLTEQNKGNILDNNDAGGTATMLLDMVRHHKKTMPGSLEENQSLNDLKGLVYDYGKNDKGEDVRYLSSELAPMLALDSDGSPKHPAYWSMLNKLQILDQKPPSARPPRTWGVPDNMVF